MTPSGRTNERRAANAQGLAAFGVDAHAANGLYREVRSGKGVTVFTIGYERRNGDQLFAALLDAGVEHLADIRDKPMSRKPDFRASALASQCEDTGIEYGRWTELGSTQDQRQRLHESGDLATFHRTFRRYAIKHLDEPIDRLAAVAKRKSVALLCYERSHDECHRSTIAELVADRLDANITAIL